MSAAGHVVLRTRPIQAEVGGKAVRIASAGSKSSSAVAQVVSGNTGTVVMENSYHGNSTLINELSMMAQPKGSRPDHVVAVDPPDRYRGALGPDGEYAALIKPALAELDARGHGVAAFLCDGISKSHGGLDAPPGNFRTRTRSHGRPAGCASPTKYSRGSRELGRCGGSCTTRSFPTSSRSANRPATASRSPA